QPVLNPPGLGIVAPHGDTKIAAAPPPSPTARVRFRPGPDRPDDASTPPILRVVAPGNRMALFPRRVAKTPPPQIAVAPPPGDGHARPAGPALDEPRVRAIGEEMLRLARSGRAG